MFSADSCRSENRRILYFSFLRNHPRDLDAMADVGALGLPLPALPAVLVCRELRGSEYEIDIRNWPSGRRFRRSTGAPATVMCNKPLTVGWISITVYQ